MNHPHEVPLSRLKYDPANIRQAGRGSEPIYKASLMQKGQIAPLIVRPAGDGVDYLVTDGGKRLASFAELAQEGAIKEDHLIKIEVREEDEKAARDTSLATAIVHTEAHPVDVYEAFAQLRKDKVSDDEIMKRYNLGRRQFNQTMALGNLAKPIRDAWRNGEIKADIAKIFTIEPDADKQESAFKALKKSGGISSEYSVREKLSKSDERVSSLVKFVGVEAVRAEGGKVNEDLFGDDHQTKDVKLVERLAFRRLNDECNRLKAEGWSWALPEEDLPTKPNHWRNWQKIPFKEQYTAEEKKRLDEIDELTNWDRDDVIRAEQDAAEREGEKIQMQARARSYKPEDKAKSGCIVSIDEKGDLEIEYGVIRPKEAPVEAVKAKKLSPAEQKAAEKKAKEEAKKRADSKTTIPYDLKHRLSETLTRAAAKAVELDVDLGMEILIAGLMSEGEPYQEKICLRVGGELADDIISGAEFAEMLKRVQKLSPKQKLAALARLAGASFSFLHRQGGEPPLEHPDVIAVLRAIEPRDLEKSLQSEFNAADYFKTVSKALCLRAIREALGPDQAKQLAEKSAADIQKFTIAKVPSTGWLPPELRTSAYTGPTGKSESKKKV